MYKKYVQLKSLKMKAKTHLGGMPSQQRKAAKQKVNSEAYQDQPKKCSQTNSTAIHADPLLLT